MRRGPLEAAEEEALEAVVEAVVVAVVAEAVVGEVEVSHSGTSQSQPAWLAKTVLFHVFVF